MVSSQVWQEGSEGQKDCQHFQELMCSRFNALDQETEVGLPLHKAPNTLFGGIC